MHVYIYKMKSQDQLRRRLSSEVGQAGFRAAYRDLGIRVNPKPLNPEP